MHLLKIRGKNPLKYNKYSQLDLEGYEDEELLVFGTDKELSRNIEIHWIDMKSNEQNSQR